MKGHIAKKGNKYYIVVDMKDEAGNRKRKWLSGPNGGFEKKRQAELAMPDILKALHEETFVEPTKKTFGEILKVWLEDKKPTVKYNTWKSYEWLVKTHIIPALGKIQVLKLRPQHIQDFYYKLLEKLSVGSIRKVHVIINDALSREVSWGHIKQNVSQFVKLPSGKKSKFKVLNEEQLKIFLDATKEDQYYEAFEIAASTGMRQSELLALLWTEVDLKRKIASVRQAYTLSEDGGHDFDDTKSDSSERPIALFPHTAEVLEALFAKQQQRQKDNKLYKDSGLVIQTSVGTPLSPRNLMRNFYRILDKIQEEHPDFPRIRFQDLRHTHATLLLKAGIHPKIVQERLGHSSVMVTLDIYSHVLPNLQEAVLKNIGDSITGSSTTELETSESPTLLE